MAKKKLVACYCRVSTLDQGKGLASQEKALAEYAGNQGWDNVRWYKDIISGASTDRPAFDKLQKEVFRGRIGTVLVWRLDRISRKGILEGLTILSGWLEKGVRIVSVTQQLDFSGHLGQMLAGIFFALAAMERESLRENTRRGLMAAKARGVKLGKRAKLFMKDVQPLLEQGMTVAEAADQLGVTRQAIYAARNREAGK